MTSTPSDTPVIPEDVTPASAPERTKAAPAPSIQPVLEKLFELYPHLFGAEFLPLKLGVFQELLAEHPDQFDRDTLKLALGQHTRSSPYLQSVATGMQRHNLQGEPVEAMAPEHVYFAIIELFRRRQRRAREDLRPRLRNQLITAYEASGLTPQAYQARVQTKDEAANALLQDALAAYEQKAAKQEAMLRAFDSSGHTPEEFADMYGLNSRDVRAAINRRLRFQADNPPAGEATPAEPAAPTPDADPA